MEYNKNNPYLINLNYSKYRLFKQPKSGGNIVDYKYIAKAVGRSPTTVRKWCPRITELSGHVFITKSIYRGRKKAPLKKYVFSDNDLIKFKELARLLSETNNFQYSVYEVYGNLKAKREQDFKNYIDDLDDYCLEKFESLEKKIKSLETNNQLLSNKIATLEKFNSRLEKIEIGLRKRNIGDLLNDKN